MKKKYAHLVAEVRFIGHGYQLDIFDNTLATKDGSGVILHSECRDFPDSSKSFCERADEFAEAIKLVLRKTN